MPTTDNSLIIRDTTDGALAGNTEEKVTTGILDIRGTPSKGMEIFVTLPSTPGGSQALQVNVFGSTASVAATTDLMITSYGPLTTAGNYYVPFITNKRSIEVVNVTSGGTVSWGIVLERLVLNVGKNEQNRLIEFE
jgi:hypothetical protein